jgi:hypothetical protein
MTNLTAEKVLSVAPEGMADFIQHKAATRTLSKMVKSLNRDLVEGDQRARDKAAAALKHLGLCDQPDCC